MRTTHNDTARLHQTLRLLEIRRERCLVCVDEDKVERRIAIEAFERFSGRADYELYLS